MRHEFKEFCEKKEERHRKRLERQKKSSNGSSNGGGRRRSDNYAPRPNGSARYDYGPRYIDDNPYSSGLPAPPVGYDGR